MIDDASLHHPDMGASEREGYIPPAAGLMRLRAMAEAASARRAAATFGKNRSIRRRDLPQNRRDSQQTSSVTPGLPRGSSRRSASVAHFA